MTNEEAIRILESMKSEMLLVFDHDRKEALKLSITALRAQNVPDTNVGDTISRQALCEYALNQKDKSVTPNDIMRFPSAQIEPLTDKEQRIFLAAMGREEKVCEHVDEECRDCREPYEDSLVRICYEIIRKVKGVLWT